MTDLHDHDMSRPYPAACVRDYLALTGPHDWPAIVRVHSDGVISDHATDDGRILSRADEDDALRRAARLRLASALRLDRLWPRADLPVWVSIGDLGPLEPPSSGSDWPEEYDRPRLQLRIELPTDVGVHPYLHSALQSNDRLLDRSMDRLWGAHELGRRYRSRTYSRPTIAESERDAQIDADRAVATLLRIVSARHERMALRAEHWRLATDTPTASTS